MTRDDLIGPTYDSKFLTKKQTEQYLDDVAARMSYEQMWERFERVEFVTVKNQKISQMSRTAMALFYQNDPCDDWSVPHTQLGEVA